MDCIRRTVGCSTYTLVATARPIAGDADLVGLGIPASDTLSKNLKPLVAVWACCLFRLVSGGQWWWLFQAVGCVDVEMKTMRIHSMRVVRSWPSPCSRQARSLR